MDRRKFIVTSGTGIGLGIAGCLDATVGDESGADDGNDTDPDEFGSEDEDEDGRDEQSDDAEDGTDSDDQSTETDDEDDQSTETDDEDETDEQSGDAGERTVEFTSCARVEVDGTFEDGDVAFASTGFYDEAGYGNTLLEDGVRFGSDVEAPFTGTVIFETGSESAVDEGTDEIVVEIADHTDDGVVITGLTTEQEDYMAAGLTHENPHAEECLAERAPDDADSDDERAPDTEREGSDGEEQESDDEPPAFDVSITGTNAPVDAGDYLEVSAEIENAGGSGSEDVQLIVGNVPETVETQSVSLEAGERTSITRGYQTPPIRADQEVPVRIETETDAAEETVLVNAA